MFKDMTDEGLLQAISDVRQLLWNASQGNMAGSVFRLQRQLDIAIAVKHKRGL
jgi:hypothetical protein